MLEAAGRDRRQTAYRILVALTDADLASEQGTLWDSGLVASSQTFDIRYAGSPLPEASEVTWTVQVVDESGTPGPWATPARFRTGLAGWAAAWIRRDRAEDPPVDEPGSVELDPDELVSTDYNAKAVEPACHLRRSFDVSGGVRAATIYGTARGLVEFELNGRRVGDAVLSPGWTDYHKRIEYAAHDVTELISDGENVLGAILGAGWYAGHVGFQSKQRAAWYGSEVELLCELHLEHQDGSVTVIPTDEHWRATSSGPIRYSDLLHGEHYDARRELTGWSQPGYADDAWDPVIARSLDDVLLVPERAQPMRITEDLRPVSISERGDGIYTFDMGQNMVGWARLAVRGPAGTRVELRFGEMLEPDGSLHLRNLRSARPMETYIMRGDGTELFEPRFTFHGFRYVEVRGLPSAPTEETVTGRVVHSDTPATGTFSCSDEMVNRLASNIRWSQRGNFVSVPTDCPQRDERLGWLADAQVFLPTATLNMDVAAFISKWGDDIIDAQSSAGAYPDVAPRLVCVRDGAPAWADAGIIVPWVHYCRSGDVDLLERHWPYMERYMAYLKRHNPDLVWRRRRHQDYGDWLAVGERCPRDLLATAYWAYDAQLMGRMGRVLGCDEEAERYEHLRGEIVAAWQAAFLSEDALVQGDTQTGYLLALAFDLLPSEQRARAAERLVANIERRDWHLTTGFVGVGLLCPVLTEAGYPDVAHRLLRQDTFPSWGYSIQHGATTIWERWDGWTKERGFDKAMNSFNHYSLGSVGSWLYEYVAGIRSDTDDAAYEKAVIAPVPGDLRWARASYRSVRGEIVSDWVREPDCFKLVVTIPPNVTATVLVPGYDRPLTESGDDVASAVGVHAVGREADAWRIEVGSGTYRFQVG